MANLDSKVGIIYTLSADVKDAEKEIKRFESETDKLGKGGKSGLDSLTSSTGSAGAGFLSMVNPVTLAVTAITAVATSALTVGTALFSLTKSSSDFASEINDVNAKTGISTDTLQALRFAASQGGASFSEVSSSVSKFAKVLGSAQQGSAEAQKTLKNLGVTSGDMETALGQAYQTILKYPEGFDQMKAAMDGFGKSGSELLPFLKEFDGDLGGLKRRAAELGLILDEETIRAGDKFGDTFDLIGLQAKTAGARFALEFAPAITQGMNLVSQFLIDNQAEFKEWGQKVDDALLGAVNDVKAKGGDFEAVGKVIGDNIAKGIGRGLGAIVDEIKKELQEIDDGKRKVYTPMQFGADIADYFNRRNDIKFGQKIDTSALATPEMKAAQTLIKDIEASTENIKKHVGDTPSLSKQAELEKAREEAKKLSESINKIALDLANQIHFFGDESAVAAAQQKLLTLGITDFSTGQAKAVIGLAEMIDKLKEGKKATDEYNQKLKDARKELASFDQKALDGLIPDQSELDRFNRWAKNSTADMSALRDEIRLTRDFLKSALEFQALLDSQKRFGDLSKSVSETTNSLDLGTRKLTPFQEQLLSVAKAANLVGTELKGLGKIGTTVGTVDLTAEVFAGKGSEFVNKYKKEIDEFKEAIRNIDASPEFNNAVAAAATDAQIKNKENLDKIIADYTKFLKTLQTIGKDAEGKTTTVPLFAADYEIEAFISQLLNLDKTVNKATLKSGVEKLDGVLEKLGITIDGVGKTTELEKLNKLLSDDAITQAIKLRAAALGYTADELTRLLQMRTQDIESGATTGTRPRVVGEDATETDLSLGESVLTSIDAAGNRVTKLSGAFSELKNIAGDALRSMAQGIGNMVQNMVLLGNTGGQSFKKLVASVLAGVAAQAATLAVMELAYGIAALTPWGFAVYGDPSKHFTAAALFGSIAVGTGLAGRAVAGDSFKQQTATGANNPSTGGITNGSGQGERGRGGAYSGEGDKVTTYESGANSPEVVRHEIDFTDRNGRRERWMVDTLKDNVGRNGDLRDLFKKLIEE